MSMVGRARSLTPRQAVTLGGGLLLAAAIAGALALGSTAAAIALLGALNLGILVALVQLRRRLAQTAHRLRRQGRGIHATHDEVKRTGSRLGEDMEALAGKVDFAQRRVIGALEGERMAAADRHRALTESMEGHGELLGRHQHDLKVEIERQRAGIEHQRAQIERQRAGVERLSKSLPSRSVRQVEALLQLYEGIERRAAMPPSGGWALDPTGLLALCEIVRDRRPKLILELGSGSSSVWLGYVLEQLGSGRVVSVDHEQRFADATRACLEAHRLEHVVEVRVAPLVDVGIPDHPTPWYDPRELEHLGEIDLLVVDGPPKAVGRVSRYPALPVLGPRLHESSIVAIDDADREDEREIVERWCREIPGLCRREASIADSLAVLETRSAPHTSDPPGG